MTCLLTPIFFFQSQEHLFTQETKLTLKHQRTALVTCVLPGDELPGTQAEASSPSSGLPVSRSLCRRQKTQGSLVQSSPSIC